VDLDRQIVISGFLDPIGFASFDLSGRGFDPINSNELGGVGLGGEPGFALFFQGPGHPGTNRGGQIWTVVTFPGIIGVDGLGGVGRWEPEGVPDAATSSISLLAISLTAMGALVWRSKNTEGVSGVASVRDAEA